MALLPAVAGFMHALFRYDAAAQSAAARQFGDRRLLQQAVRAGGGLQGVDVTVQPLHEPAALQGTVMIVFRDVAAPESGGRRRGASAMEASHAAEVQQCRAEIQSLRAENRASREDLQSAIINLRDSDIGRPLSDLTTSLQYPALTDDAHETLRTLVFSEKQIQSSDRRWFSARIMPYRRLDNVIDGAVS